MSHDEQPATATRPLTLYVASSGKLMGLVSFVGHLIVRADEGGVIAARALLPGAKDDEERRKLEETIERGGLGVQKTMQDHFAHMFTRLVYQRAVDDFLSYVADLLHLIYATRPEALTSSETVRLEEILRYASMDELVTFLVERRVERLAYQSLVDLSADVEKSLGLTLFGADETAQAASIVATRNLITHNRSVVNDRYLKQVPECTKSVGQEIWVSADSLFETMKFLGAAAARIDNAAIGHFGLPTEVAGAPEAEVAGEEDDLIP